jgi:DNA-binding protein YbaB
VTDDDPNAALRARFDDALARYADLRDGVGRLQRDLEEVQATVRSPDGMVTVVAGPGGAVKRVELHERAYQAHPPHRLAELIGQAARHAAAAVNHLVQQRISEMTPDGIGLDRLLARHDSLMEYREDGS